MPTAVRDVMTTDVVSFTRDETVGDAMQRLLAPASSGDPWSTGIARSSACSPTAT